MSGGSGFVVEIIGGGASEEEVYSLREELAAVRGVAVEREVSEDLTEGAKALGAELMALAVKAGLGAIPDVIQTIGGWLTRQRPGTKLKVRQGDQEFEFEGEIDPKLAAALLDRLVKQA
jgi:hypothetical protein